MYENYIPTYYAHVCNVYVDHCICTNVSACVLIVKPYTNKLAVDSYARIKNGKKSDPIIPTLMVQGMT